MSFVVADDNRKPKCYKRCISRENIEKLTKENPFNFNYRRYVGLIKYAEAKQELGKDDIEIKNLYVLRNVYKNEVFVDRNDNHVFELNNDCWTEYFRYDDYEVYGAKMIIDRAMGSLPARIFMSELHGKTNLRVEGAVLIKDTFYTLTQVILPDSFVDLPSNLKTKKIMDLYNVQIIGVDYEKEMRLMAVNSALKIVEKG